MRIPTGWRRLKASETLMEGDRFLVKGEFKEEWVETHYLGQKVAGRPLKYIRKVAKEKKP